MATRLYLANNGYGNFNPATRKGAWDKTSGASLSTLTPERLGYGHSFTNTENNAANDYDVLVVTFVSDPLAADVAISGTLTGVLLTAESSTDANLITHAHLWVTTGDSDTARGTLLADYIGSTEWAQSSSANSKTADVISSQALTTVNALEDDRLVFELGFRAQNTVTTNYTGGVNGGGNNTADADGSESGASPANAKMPWIELSSTLTFKYDYLRMTALAAPETPASNRGTWDVDNHDDKYLSRSGDATTGDRGVTETSAANPTDGLITRFVSDPLAAQTIGSVGFHVVPRMYESASAANAFPKIHAYVMDPSDGSVRGTLVSNTVGANEITSATVMNEGITTTCSSVDAEDDDVLVVEVGARFTNAVTTSYTANLNRGGLTGLSGGQVGEAFGAATSGDQSGWIRIDQDILWLDELPSGTDATGTVSAQALTVTGSTATGTAGTGASGTVTGHAITVTGSTATGTAGTGASGTVEGQAITVTGSTAEGTVDNTITGTVSGQALAVSHSTATGTAGQGATGMVAAQSLSVTGSTATGAITQDATGTVAAQALSVTGSTATGTAGQGATGTVSGQSLTVAGSVATGAVSVIPSPVTFTADNLPYLHATADSVAVTAHFPDTRPVVTFTTDSVQGDFA